ncbi:MAG: hypothetical protein IPN17_38485 [Deltaproteobacteria bacterium]|nr:hypothetical protein [Deltaproteobacteria bacterium]
MLSILMSERSLPVVMLTSQGSEKKVAVEALKHGAGLPAEGRAQPRAASGEAIDLAIEQAAAQ